MNILNGSLEQINNLEGSLNIESELTGALSTVDSVLTGELVTDETYELVGSLSTEELSLNGKLHIPPEVPIENYQGNYTVVSKPFKVNTLNTSGLRMTQDITVEKIPYYETGNESGYTVYIGGE